jgi:hypothetical protein
MTLRQIENNQSGIGFQPVIQDSHRLEAYATVKNNAR